jgi:uncharacterized membrane protein
MYAVQKQKTGWFHLATVLVITLISFYFIKNAFAKPFAEFQTYNELRYSEIRAAESSIEVEPPTE